MSFESKRKESYLCTWTYKGQIYLLSHQTFQLQSITGVIVIDLIINYYNSSEVNLGESFGILPNIRPNDEYKSPQQGNSTCHNPQMDQKKILGDQAIFYDQII